MCAHRSRLVGECAPAIEQCLADEEKGQQCQQDSYTGDSHGTYHCHQQLVTVPRRLCSHTLGGRGKIPSSFLQERGRDGKGGREPEWRDKPSREIKLRRYIGCLM